MDDFMNTDNQACFFYPTTVVILDDNRTFLDHLPSNLIQNFTYKLFDLTHEAMEFLTHQKKNIPSPNDFLENSDDYITNPLVFVNVSKIYAQLYNQKRFEIPSILIVDHDMPGMTGIEFCQALGNYPIKRIMLTGIADYKKATQAFNDGLINKFILKEDPNVFQALDQAIQVLQQDYFTQLSDSIIKNINVSLSSLLGQKNYQTFFSSFIKDNNIREYYLSDLAGSFLLVSHANELIWLVVQSEQDMNNFYQIGMDHGASPDVLAVLKKKEAMLCLFSESQFKEPVSNWSNHLQTTHAFKDIDGYYYSVIRGDEAVKATGVFCQEENIVFTS